MTRGTNACICMEYLSMHIVFPGEKEDLNDKLGSILSQLEFVHQVTLWEKKGVPFKKRFYVPEVHPLTGAEFHEREDDAHVLKVCCQGVPIWICILCTLINYFYTLTVTVHVSLPMQRIATSTRVGGPEQLKLERFGEALEDPTSGLTYQSLTG